LLVVLKKKLEYIIARTKNVFKLFKHMIVWIYKVRFSLDDKFIFGVGNKGYFGIYEKKQNEKEYK
jgi:hypothetical protein